MKQNPLGGGTNSENIPVSSSKKPAKACYAFYHQVKYFQQIITVLLCGGREIIALLLFLFIVPSWWAILSEKNIVSK